MSPQKSTKESIKIVVTGDITIDWLEVSTPPIVPEKEKQKIPNWQRIEGTSQFAKLGGSLLLAEFMKASTSPGSVLSPSLSKIENIPPDKIIHSLVSLEKYPFSKKEENKVYRVSKFKGYSGPKDNSPEFLEVDNDDPNAKILVLDDAGNGFRDAPEKYWPLAVTNGKPEFILYKMSNPLAEGKLWEKVSKDFPDKLIIIINADDLRRYGAKISRKVSWESTATDFVWQMASNPKLFPLNNCAHLIVRFGVDGAIIYRRREGDVEAQLLYDPRIGEDCFSEDYPGKMLGIGAPFVASIASSLLKKKKNKLKEGVQQGLLASRKLWQIGFGKDFNKLEYKYSEVFNTKGKNNTIIDVDIPFSSGFDSADPDYWCILDDITDLGLETAAFNYVKYGKDSSLLKVPLGQFGNKRTFSRLEIESLSNIKNLIQEYLSTPDINRPLSIAVFGPPGSGKSFTVTEVAKSVAPEKLARETLDFNLSQFNSPNELINAFHRIRDVSLKGKIPIVFFDEFDCDFNGKLGWLKYFLYPMNDGLFREGEILHPIGRAIFVFAGGTCETFDKFSREKTKGKKNEKKSQESDEKKEKENKTTESNTASKKAKKNQETKVVENETNNKDNNDKDNKLDKKSSDDQSFIDAKGPDFVSRLRGYIDIKGPNPLNDEDKHYMIRRAIFLRFLLQKNAANIFDSNKKCNIDSGVLRAMIKVPEYKHGVRSIEAIIEMSMFAGRKSFEQAALPSKEQLKLHVNTYEFSRLVNRDVLLGASREELARAIHERFLENHKDKEEKTEAMKPWEELSKGIQETNIQQADDIPNKLKAINCDFTPVKPGKQPKSIKFTKDEIEIMAELEHERWVQQKFIQGWSYGKDRDDKKKTHPCLVEWDKLTEEIKEKDRNAVRAIPELLASKGFEVYRLKDKT